MNDVNKLFFSTEDIARTLNISHAAAKVSASRNLSRGRILRLKRNIYVTRENWRMLSRDQIYRLANILQTPSYISLTTALAYHEVTTQIQQNFIESIAVKRTKLITIKETSFNYQKMEQDLYFGFQKVNGFFIANAEKAFLDAVYLCSFGKYALDISAIDTSKLDEIRLKEYAVKFPDRTKRWIEQWMI